MYSGQGFFGVIYILLTMLCQISKKSWLSSTLNTYAEYKEKSLTTYLFIIMLKYLNYI